MACTSCEIRVLDMNLPDVVARATEFGIRSVPAEVVNGKLTECCINRGVDESVLHAAGFGQPLA